MLSIIHLYVPLITGVLLCAEVLPGSLEDSPLPLQDEDLCITSNPCLNGATCSLVPTGVFCKCVPGFIGPNCQLNKDECRSNPCTNGGTCIDLLNGYQCTCPPGFTGNNCQNVFDPCTPSPCLKGTCSSAAGSYSCSCDVGYTGKNCEIMYDYCSSNPCIFGTCSSFPGYYSCSCDAGHTGQNCDTVVTTPAPGGYDCEQNNPCLDPNNINNDRFYFPHHDPTKFVQCSEWGQCFVMPCAPGTVWDSTVYTCVAIETTVPPTTSTTASCISERPYRVRDQARPHHRGH